MFAEDMFMAGVHKDVMIRKSVDIVCELTLCGMI